MKLLLINPRFPESFWSFKWTLDTIIPTNKRTVNPPLGLATLAALCPEDWEVEIVDENVESIPLEPEADIIGICGMGIQFNRQKELLGYYRGKGYFVVAGGSYASLCPELYEDIADTVIAGEAEYIWKEFCGDFTSGDHRKLYHETGEVDLADSPVPRFDLLKLDRYQAVSLQFSRGCPFRCEFCDIIVMFGRKPRTKKLEQVGRELDLLRELGIDNVFFVDDNLIGNKPVAKKLLTYLAQYQKEHNFRFQFGTEASLNMAQDSELLRMFREAHFEWVFVGIESPDEESLKETLKFQNTREDILTSIQKIYSNGIEVLAGFIIGFDNDTYEVFDKQYNFIQKSGIQASMIGLLTAIPKTPLYERLQKEGRVRKDAENTDNTKLKTNIIPLQMEYERMIDGYRDLYFRLLDDRSISERVSSKLSHLGSPVYKTIYTPSQQITILKRFFLHGLLPGGISRFFHFARSLPFIKPSLIPLVIKDWTIALSMRDYIERHFITENDDRYKYAGSYAGRIKRSLHSYISSGLLEVSLRQAQTKASDICISMKGLLDREFYNSAGQHIEELLQNSASSVTLDVRAFHESQSEHFKHFLNRLSRYGDRIYIRIDGELRRSVEVDSSVFNLVLDT